MSKRSNGEGTIYKRKDGRWCASKHVILADGVSKRKTVYGLLTRRMMSCEWIRKTTKKA